MKLDDTQTRTVAEWIGQGLKIGEIQNRIGSEFGMRMTYMDVRLLVDDLKLTPLDPEPVKAPDFALARPPTAGESSAAPSAPPSAALGQDPSRPPGSLSVSVDHLARQGSVVSGKVTFSDGNEADWYLDQTGRLGLAPVKAGYRPPAADVKEFQTALDIELRKLGF